MEKSNKTSLLYTHNFSRSLSRLRIFNRENKSNRVALLVLVLVIFAVAAFSLAATASGVNPHATAGTAAQTGSLQFSAPAYLAAESGGNASITVVRAGGSGGALSVTVSTSGGTATAGQDYTAITSALLSFPDGVTSRTFTLSIIDDNVDEADETVILTLSNQTGGTPGSPLTATLTIADDDTAALSINDLTVAEGNRGTSNATFRVSLSNPSSQVISVNFATANDTATAGSDYVAASGSVAFNPGETLKTIDVRINGDLEDEPDERFFVNLSGAIGGPISDGQAVGTIFNDDVRLDTPGLVPTDNSLPGDQKAGSVLIFPIYTSLASASNLQNTRINITNIDTRRSAFIHLFLVDGATCAVGDVFLCLTANQTTSFVASDVDPGTTGYLIAVAVDANGCPTIFNALIGDEYVKLDSGHAANLGATAVTGFSGIINSPTCAPGSSAAQLNFDGVSYGMLPRVLAADNLPDRISGNNTLLILDRIGGNLATGAATLGAIFGLLFDDAENVLSFSFNAPGCQLRQSISNSFPRTTPRFDQVVPAGRSGWLKLWSFSDIALVGAVINFNPNHLSAPGAFNQGHNLHIMTLTNAASVTIPVFPPTC